MAVEKPLAPVDIGPRPVETPEENLSLIHI